MCVYAVVINPGVQVNDRVVDMFAPLQEDCKIQVSFTGCDALCAAVWCANVL